MGEPPDNARALLELDGGLYSGIPRCCIRFFVKVWTRLYLAGGQPAMDAHRDVVQASGLHAHYILCPACILSRNVVELKRGVPKSFKKFERLAGALERSVQRRDAEAVK